MPVIAIDGPSGSGKSTLAGALAERLGLERLDTGAMYRAITLVALRKGLDLGDSTELAMLARMVVIELGDHVVVDGEDVTEAIRTESVNRAVSVVSAHPGVRAELVSRQRAWVENRGGGVVEGRDIGSFVFPDADVKIFLTADQDERARRRAAEEDSVDVASVSDSLANRDALDSSRTTSPLVVAQNAVVLDTTHHSVEDLVTKVVELL